MANAFVHIELNTDDVPAARKFYKSLFKWTLQDMPEMGYTMIDTGKGKTGGGMMAKPMADAPTQWLAYVEVDDVKKTVAKAKKLGAQIVVPYQPIPGMGSMGIFIDPTGGALGVWAPEKKPARRPVKAAKKAAPRARASRRTTRS